MTSLHFRALTPGRLILALSACGLPTDPPLIDSSWVVPLPADSLTVAEFVPDGVTVDGGHFLIAAPRAEASRTLGELCPSCPTALAPKPAFEGAVTAETTLPAEVVRATLAEGGEVAFTVDHGLAFDPLRPTPQSIGQITISMRSGGALIASSVIDGATTALPPDVLHQHVIPLPEGAVIGNDVQVEMRIASPAGELTQLDRNQRVSVSAVPRNIRATSAVVRIENRIVSPVATRLDVGEAGDGVRSRVRDATLELALDNPFAIEGEFTIRFLSDGAPLIPDRSVRLTEGDTVITVPLDRQEIDAILAADEADVELSGTVTGSAPDREVTVTPGQVIRIAPRLILSVRIGG